MSQITDPSKVVCVGEGLHFGYFTHPIHATVDTRKAGPGELTAYCDGPDKKAYCELRDHEDGTFTLTVRPQDVGMHRLHIQYNDHNVPGSPFNLMVSSASLVEVHGAGIENGVLRRGSNYEIQLDTQQAGPGNLSVKIGGPRGAFKVQTKKEDKVLRCRYNPQQPGLYVINITWSNDHVPGSPFNVFLARNETELDNYLSRA